MNEPIIWTGQGPVLIGTYSPTRGTPDMGYLVDLYRVGCGNRTLTTTPGRTTRQINETCSGQRMTLDEFEQSKSLSVTLSMVQFSGRTLAAAFFGEAVGKEAGTVTDEQLPELAPGDYFVTRHPHISSLVVSDATTPTPQVYVAGTHYVVEDAAHGRCRLIAHPATHVEPLSMDYAHGAYTNIAAFSATNVERGIIFNGRNHKGQHGRVIIPRINLGLGSDFGWITDEEAALELTGNALYVAELEGDADFGPFMRIDALPAA